MRRAVISVCHLVGARIIEAQSTFGVSSISVSSSDLGARDLSLREGFGGMIFRHRLTPPRGIVKCCGLDSVITRRPYLRFFRLTPRSRTWPRLAPMGPDGT